MTWIKICGTTNLEDALLAVEAGADALGFVFYEKSPRNVSVELVREIVRELPKGVEKVGVFVNEYEDEILDTVARTGLSAVQMHGDNEDPQVADLIVSKRPDLKVFPTISMSDPSPELWARMWLPESICAFVLDSAGGARRGGTGEVFDWGAAKKSVEKIRTVGETVVAGGLTPGNVTEAMRILRPWGVDVVSGVEAGPGKKDPGKVRAFVAAVRDADSREIPALSQRTRPGRSTRLS